MTIPRETNRWPDIPYDRWKATGSSLHMWLQIVGKFRLSLTPWTNHSWHATFYVTSRGLSTSLIHGPSDSYCVDFDFIDHILVLTTQSGLSSHIALRPQSVADFYHCFVEALETVGAPAQFHTLPNEVPEARPFAEQTMPGAYQAEAAQDFWRALVSIDEVFKIFRTGFLGKSSPVHLFWGSFDFAVTRFSGREAPQHPGGISNLPDPITREAYSHEVSSAGFWAGGNGLDHPAFYSYAYPTPDGFKDHAVTVEGAYFHDGLGEFILPYDAVRKAEQPEKALLDFLQSTYRAAAEAGAWDRKSLECPFGVAGHPRVAYPVI